MQQIDRIIEDIAKEEYKSKDDKFKSAIIDKINRIEQFFKQYRQKKASYFSSNNKKIKKIPNTNKK